ncbi:MAG: hypothetical protein NTY17_08350 [Planctomycetia bacterium]|nr:hypothetical protein [Planctomycetia bacterium]
MQEPAQPAPEAERTSRQDLVVVPRKSSLPLLLGAVLCAGTGFGLVWALGIGRSGAGEDMAGPVQTALPTASPDEPAVAFAADKTVSSGDDGGAANAQPDTAPWEPRQLSPPTSDADAPRAMNERGWRAPATPAASPAPLDRYPTRPAALEAPDSPLPMPAPPAHDGRTSRFAPPGRFPGTGAEPIRLASAEAEPLDAQIPPDPVDATTPADAARSGDDVIPAETPVRSAVLHGETPLAAAPLAPPTAASTGSSGDDLLAPAPTDMAPAPLAPAPTDMAPAPLAPAPVAASAPVVSAAATNPFASAPPMGPTRSAPPATMNAMNTMTNDPRGPMSGGASSGPGSATAGQGRPGPMQLEGLQTPQLVLEKRGPREIQVGKAARYEILLRNVGTATAQDVTLRDAVPYGTTLITTTPPASPVGAGQPVVPGANPGGMTAELVWALGVITPGGEARVSMEVMPEIEGEIGSVASVSFRTEASVRSRATKPDLKLEASETKAVRIGGEMKLSLKVSNPGTGIATGVVLEGLLPDGISHSAGRELEFDVGQLRPGESRTIDLVLGSTGPGVHMARFAARADGRLEVEQPIRIEVTAPTLELSAEMPSRRYLQRPATCVLSMVNAGTAPARAVELVAQLPPGMKFVRANHAGWYEERFHRVLWNLEELPPGERGTVEMVLMPVDLGPQKIVAAARSSDGPSDQAAHTVEVEGLASLFFEVTDSEDPIEVGGMTEYIVRIANQGTKAASGVRLTATLLGDLEPVDAKGPAAHRVENLTVIFDPLARLAPTEEAVFRVRVRGRREGDQRMQVQLVSDDHPAPITKEEITRVYADR